MSGRITIKDIASALGIHHSTVSRALRDDSRVKSETRNIVKEYADAHGYQTNMVALELRGEKRRTIAILVPNINHQFFSNIVSSLTDYANEDGYVVSIFQSNESYESEVQIINTIIKYNFAGVIDSLSMESKVVDHFKELSKHQIPLVMFDRVAREINVPKVLINNADIMRQAVYKLSERGYERIMHISGPSHLSVFGERQQGYTQAITELGKKYHQIKTFNKGFSVNDGKELANELFSLKIKPNAIICDSSNLAYGLLISMRERGILIPKDMAVITFGEDSSLKIMQPSITSIVQPTEEVAKSAYKLLSQKLNSEGGDRNETIILSAKIEVRESI